MSQPALASSDPEPPLPADNIVVLQDVSWEDFQRVLQIRGERCVPRLTYLEGVLELMSPSLTHESIKSMIGCLVEGWCFEKGVDITPYGSWTLKRKKVRRAVEPDECYVVGDAQEIPKSPDLAIEVALSHGAIDKLEVYRKLGVKELWIWETGTVRLFGLRGEEYVPIENSGMLPGIDLPLLLRFVAVRPMTRAVTEYRAALRAQG